MSPEDRISTHLDSLPPARRHDMQALHHDILHRLPQARLWFLDGKTPEGKTVANPSIGYGVHRVRHADGASREVFAIGISAHTTGLSVYLMAMDDKTYLTRTYGDSLGKAKVTGSCIRFRTLADIDLEVLGAAILDGARRP